MTNREYLLKVIKPQIMQYLSCLKEKREKDAPVR